MKTFTKGQTVAYMRRPGVWEIVKSEINFLVFADCDKYTITNGAFTIDHVRETELLARSHRLFQTYVDGV